MRTISGLLRIIACAALVLWAFVAGAQTIDMTANQGVDFRDTKTLGAAYPGGITAVTAQYPAAVQCFRQWWGFTDADILATYEAPAAVWQAVWSGDGYLPGSQTYDKLQSRADVLHPHGAFLTNIPLPLHLGQNRGRGQNYSDAVGTTGGTKWKIDEARWNPKCGERTLFRSLVYGGTAGSGDYLEGAVLKDMFLDGGRFMQATNGAQTIGIDAEKMGSNSLVHNMRVDGFDIGTRVTYGIPVNFDLLRAFGCNVTAVLLEGTALSSMHFEDVEVDDTPTAFSMVGNADQVAGSKSLTVPNLKVEFGKRGRTTGLGKMMELRGQFNVIVDDATSSGYNGARCPAAFTIEKGSRGSLQGRGFMHCGNNPPANSYDVFLDDGTYTYDMPPYCVPFDFKWKNGVFTSDPVVTRRRK